MLTNAANPCRKTLTKRCLVPEARFLGSSRPELRGCNRPLRLNRSASDSLGGARGLRGGGRHRQRLDLCFGRVGFPTDGQHVAGGDGQHQPQSARAVGVGHPGHLPLPASVFEQLEPVFDPSPHPVPQAFALVRPQVGQNEPWFVVTGFPAGQERAIEPSPCRLREGHTTSLPSLPELRTNAVTGMLDRDPFLRNLLM